jgi:metal-responsive CopG/Arc/MetJ family transcriptional regulator
MTGRNINIYLQENLHKQLLPLIKERRVSKFINEAIAEKLTKEQKKEREELKKKMIAGYQAVVKNKKLKEELKVWDEAVGDGLDE